MDTCEICGKPDISVTKIDEVLICASCEVDFQATINDPTFQALAKALDEIRPEEGL